MSFGVDVDVQLTDWLNSNTSAVTSVSVRQKLFETVCTVFGSCKDSHGEMLMLKLRLNLKPMLPPLLLLL